MKTGEAAKILGVDRTTIINWIENRGLERFFSNGANGVDGGTQRTLTESDLLILNTIRARRSENMEWPMIARFLETGQRETEVPQNAASADTRTIPVQQAEVSARALATVAERDQALARVDELTAQLQQAREQELKLLREIADLNREVGGQLTLQQELARRDAQIEAFNRKVEELSRQIGKLEGQVEFYRESKSKNGMDE